MELRRGHGRPICLRSPPRCSPMTARVARGGKRPAPTVEAPARARPIARADPEQHRRPERGPAPSAALRLGGLGVVNANGGDWGYITVVWTMQDREGPEGRVQPPDVPGSLLRVPCPADRAGGHEVRGEASEPTVPRPAGRSSRTSRAPRAPGLRPDWDEPAKWREFFERRPLADPARLDRSSATSRTSGASGAARSTRPATPTTSPTSWTSSRARRASTS